MHKSFLCFILIACCWLHGCGYHLSRPANSATMGGKSIAIPVFANKSFKPNLEAILTGSLVDEFAWRNGGTVVGEDAAQVVLTGTILSYAVSPVSYTAADRIREYRTTVTIEATLREKESRRVLWKGSESFSQDYPANTNIALQQNSEDAAIREICRKLARQVYQKITEGF